jgi:hypothetical protein
VEILVHVIVAVMILILEAIRVLATLAALISAVVMIDNI